MDFLKVHGLGNDFILVNDLPQELTDYPSLALKLCDRHFGIGGDGLVLLHPSEEASYKMRIFNSDGSEAEMCGNAIRCLGKYIYERGLIDKTMLTVETKAGIKTLRLTVSGRQVKQVEVNMGAPVLVPGKIPVTLDGDKVVNQEIDIEGQKFFFTAVSMGNPHCVIFVPSVERIDLEKYGPLLETHHFFPEKTNVEFVEIESRDSARAVVWERGAGRTLACGTGACAVLVAGVLVDKLDAAARIKLPGGELEICWHEDGQVLMSGSAVEVFQGQVCLD